MRNIAALGGGHGARTIAADLALAGHETPDGIHVPHRRRDCRTGLFFDRQNTETMRHRRPRRRRNRRICKNGKARAEDSVGQLRHVQQTAAYQASLTVEYIYPDPSERQRMNLRL